MRDFIKIFLVLTGIVIAFVSGRNYGENTVIQSQEYKLKISRLNEIEKSLQNFNSTKEKIQILFEDTEFNKKNDFYGQLLTLLVFDLDLDLSDQQRKQIEQNKNYVNQCVANNKPSVKKDESLTEDRAVAAVEEDKERETSQKQKKWNKVGEKKFKSMESSLLQSLKDSDIRKNLNNLIISNMDAFIKESSTVQFEEIENYEGTYRGQVTAINGDSYGSLIVQIGVDKEAKGFVTENIKLYRQGREELTVDNKLKTYKQSEYSAVVMDLENRYLQIYKLQNKEKITGHFYERLPNGTSKLIGSFVLSRTDKF